MPVIPTFVIVPVLIAAFVILAYDIYCLDPDNAVLNIRFLLMVVAVLVMFFQILAGDAFPGLSFPIFLLSLLVLVAGFVFIRRRLASTA